MLDFSALGHWSEGRVAATWVASSRPIILEVEAAIEAAWAKAASRPAVYLFNGPMCRLESFDAAPEALRLKLSPSDYKTMVGTNLANASLADRYGQAVLGNGVGLSTSILSTDGHIMLGRRNARVNYYPSRIHPFSGSLEPSETIDVFAEVRRELWEELALGPEQVESIVCVGIAVDRSIRQPEMMFITQTRLDLHALRARLDMAEHEGVWSAPLDANGLMTIDVAGFTPVGVAALLLTGRAKFGADWFDRHAAAFVH